jgi:hypothetical protein
MTLLIAAGLLVFQNVHLRRQVAQIQVSSDEQRQREEELKKEIEAQRLTTSQTEQEMARKRSERERLDQELRKQNVQERTTQSQPPSLPGQTGIASFILTPGLRGVGQIQTLSIPPASRRVALQLNLEPNDYQAYRVALIDQSNHQALWQSGKLSAHSGDSGKSVSVSFSSGLLKPQTYVMQLSGVSASGNIEVMSDYPFKVVK